jgi:putative endonuclease
MARADSPHITDGARAEALAARHLAARGLSIVARNVRSRFGEIDLVAREGDTLVFVEVRLRRSPGFGGAAASITAAKRARLVKAAAGYLATLRSEPACRFDAVLLDGLDPGRIEWLKDVVSD